MLDCLALHKVFASLSCCPKKMSSDVAGPTEDCFLRYEQQHEKEPHQRVQKIEALLLQQTAVAGCSMPCRSMDLYGTMAANHYHTATKKGCK